MMTLTPGTTFAALGSKFPVPFEVVRVHPVKPFVTIRESFGDVVFEREVATSVLAHSVRVWTAKAGR